MLRYCLLTVSFFMSYYFVLGQTKVEIQDSLQAYVSTGTVLSSKSFAPFYLINNQYGEVDGDAPVFLKGEVGYKRTISESWSLLSGLGFRNERFSTYYVRAKFKDWEFTAGRAKRTYGGLPSGLSSGSLAMSENALPLPMIELSLT